MLVLCLFVIVAALFITIANSPAANVLSGSSRPKDEGASPTFPRASYEADDVVHQSFSKEVKQMELTNA